MTFKKGNEVNKGRVFSEVHKKNMRLAKTGNKNPMFGKHPSEETRKKLGIISKNRVRTEEWKNKTRNTLLGHTVSDETKQKIRKAKLGKKLGPLSSIAKMKISLARRGMKFSEKHKNNLSKSSIGKKCGNKHYNWKGGITPENNKIRTSLEYKLWRRSVFERDNYTCQKYGTFGGKLNAHHINNFSEKQELRFAIDNGVTLSDGAHKEFHIRFGRKNNTREQLEEFLKTNL